MLLLLALLLAASQVPAPAVTFTHGGRFLDDLELAQRFFKNPAEAEEALLGKTMVLLARVQSIRHRSAGALFDVELGPRTTPIMPVECALSRTAAARLKRGQLLIVEGLLARGNRNELRLTKCRVAYDFAVEPEAAGVAVDSCMLKLTEEHCKSHGCDHEGDAVRRSMLGTRAKNNESGSRAVACWNPLLLVFVVRCRGDEPRLASCTERSEIVSILNEVAITEDGKTRIDTSDELEVEKPDRGPLLDAAIRSGALPDEEP